MAILKQYYLCIVGNHVTRKTPVPNYIIFKRMKRIYKTNTT